MLGTGRAITESGGSPESAWQRWQAMDTWKRALVTIGTALVVIVVAEFVLVQVGERANREARWEHTFDEMLER